MWDFCYIYSRDRLQLSIPANRSQDMVRKQLLHYEILEKLGEGGMGRVYRARDTRLDRDVALKFVTDSADDASVRERFLREARAASRLSHPNIVGIHYIESVDEGDFMVMEYVRGRPLSDVIVAGAVPVDQVTLVAREIAAALAAAHKAGIVHRDVKPDNILLTDDGHAKMLDFGIARVAGADRLTRTDATLGTLAYMSPEQARGEEVDARSDLFSFGTVLYELATGTSPFKGDYAAATVFRIVNEDPPSAGQLRPDLPQVLELVISRCLRKRPDDRFSSADEVVDALNTRNAAEPVGAVEAPLNTTARTHRVMPKPRGLAIAAFAIAAIVVGLYFLMRPSSIPSIAVLPFENSTGDEDIDFLCEGIAESLINRLSPLPGLKVISRRSAFDVTAKTADPAEIGRLLNVNTVLLGRMEKRGDDLSISAELVDTQENRQLWGEKYRRSSSQILDLEDEIATSIATKLQGRLSSQVEKTVTQPATTNSEAYQLYLQGRFLTVGRSRDSKRALELFKRATDLDPDFALAWAGIAQNLAIQAFLTYGSREELLGDARQALQKSLELGPDLSEVHNAAGLIRFYFDWDWDGAEAGFKRAIELNPGNAGAYNRYSTFLIAMGREEEALTMARRAAALDPISTGPTHDLGIVYFLRGEYTEAIKQFDRAVELHPDWSWGYVKGGLANAMAGNPSRALELVRIAQEKVDNWGGSLLQAWIAWVYVTAGRRDLAEETLQQMLDRADDGYVDAASLADVYAALEDDEKTLYYLEKAVDEGSPDVVYIKAGAGGFYRRVSSDPRFQALLRRMAFPS